MKNRIVSLLLVFLIVCIYIPFTAVSGEDEPEGVNASSYLELYTASLSSKGITGKLTLSYQVLATHTMQKVGVWGIYVRNSNGTIHQFIQGTAANGLLATNTWFHNSSYTLNLTSGNTYYCTVIFIAKDASGTDTRQMTTQTVCCP